MAKNIKLTYFNGKGRGELSRLILAYAAVPYEDNRVEFQEWPSLKPKMPLGVMPVLVYDGEVLSQSKTIGRFLAKEFGIAGKTNLEQAKADMIVDCVTDIEIARYKWYWDPDPTSKENGRRAFEKDTLPKFLNQMLNIFQQGKGTFMVGAELTWADIAVAGFLDLCMLEVNVDKDKFKPLIDLMENVFEIPNVKSYLATRPILTLPILFFYHKQKKIAIQYKQS